MIDENRPRRTEIAENPPENPSEIRRGPAAPNGRTAFCREDAGDERSLVQGTSFAGSGLAFSPA